MAKTKVGTNYTALPFPPDPHGTNRALRNGGIEAVRRIHGNPEKYDRFRETIKVILQFAEETFERDTAPASEVAKGE